VPNIMYINVMASETLSKTLKHITL